MEDPNNLSDFDLDEYEKSVRIEKRLLLKSLENIKSKLLEINLIKEKRKEEKRIKNMKAGLIG